MRLLTVEEFADRLRIKPSTARSWIWKRKIPFVKIGARAVRISEEVANYLIRAGTVTPLNSELYKPPPAQIPSAPR